MSRFGRWFEGDIPHATLSLAPPVGVVAAEIRVVAKTIASVVMHAQTVDRAFASPAHRSNARPAEIIVVRPADSSTRPIAARPSAPCSGDRRARQGHSRHSALPCGPRRTSTVSMSNSVPIVPMPLKSMSSTRKPTDGFGRTLVLFEFTRHRESADSVPGAVPGPVHVWNDSVSSSKCWIASASTSGASRTVTLDGNSPPSARECRHVRRSRRSGHRQLGQLPANDRTTAGLRWIAAVDLLHAPFLRRHYPDQVPRVPTPTPWPERISGRMTTPVAAETIASDDRYRHAALNRR